MSSDQELLSDIYGWTSFVIFLVFLAQTFGLSVFKLVRSMFKGEVEVSYPFLTGWVGYSNLSLINNISCLITIQSLSCFHFQGTRSKSAD